MSLAAASIAKDLDTNHSDLMFLADLLELKVAALEDGRSGLMVADQGANDAQGIVVEEHFTGFGTVSLQEQANHLRDVGLDRTAVVAAGRLFALQAAPGLVYYVDSHELPGFPESQ